MEEFYKKDYKLYVYLFYDELHHGNFLACFCPDVRACWRLNQWDRDGRLIFPLHSLDDIPGGFDEGFSPWFDEHHLQFDYIFDYDYEILCNSLRANQKHIIPFDYRLTTF